MRKGLGIREQGTGKTAAAKQFSKAYMEQDPTRWQLGFAFASLGLILAGGIYSSFFHTRYDHYPANDHLAHYGRAVSVLGANPFMNRVLSAELPLSFSLFLIPLWLNAIYFLVWHGLHRTHPNMFQMHTAAEWLAAGYGLGFAGQMLYGIWLKEKSDNIRLRRRNSRGERQ